jgi:hypothetical protein
MRTNLPQASSSRSDPDLLDRMKILQEEVDALRAVNEVMDSRLARMEKLLVKIAGRSKKSRRVLESVEVPRVAEEKEDEEEKGEEKEDDPAEFDPAPGDSEEEVTRKKREGKKRKE